MGEFTSYDALLTDVLSELVAVCLEYAENTVSDIFVYASIENGRTIDPFFVSGGNVVTRGYLPGVDTSFDRQDALLDYGNDQLKRLVDECPRLGHPVPTEIKLHYIVASGKTDAEFKYEPQWSNTPDLYFHDISEAWQEEVRQSLATKK